MKRLSYLLSGTLILLLSGCATTPAAGIWDITAASSVGSSSQVLIVNPDLSGSLIADGGESLVINNGKYSEGMFTFDVTYTVERTRMSARYQVKIEDDVIRGEYLTARGSSSVTGQRRAR